MNKKLIIPAVVVVAIGALAYFGWGATQKSVSPSVVTDYKNATYIINGSPVTLVNGVSETEAAPGSVSKITTRYFGNEVKYDFNHDGREDVAFLLTQETGGSGTFYYVVAALNTTNGYIGSQGVLLGDRIAPQTTEISKNPSHVDVIVVNYADRALGESFVVAPSVGKSIYLKLSTTTMQFGEVVKDFEGEADPARMKLNMKTWNWIKAQYNDGKEIVPKKTGVFTLTFKSDTVFGASTDCNGLGGNYEAKDGALAFSKMFSTEMYCEGSQENDFTKLLENTARYHFTSKGELIFDLKYDSGVVIFK